MSKLAKKIDKDELAGWLEETVVDCDHRRAIIKILDTVPPDPTKIAEKLVEEHGLQNVTGAWILGFSRDYDGPMACEDSAALTRFVTAALKRIYEEE